MGRPFGGGDGVAGGPAFDFPNAFDHEGVTQILAQTHGPERIDGVSPVAGHGLANRGIRRQARFMKASNEVERQERRVRRHANDPLRLRSMRPIQPGKDAGEWSREFRHVIRDHLQSGRREPSGVAVGIQDQLGALRLQTGDDPFEHGAIANLAHQLVAAAQASREPARQQDANRWWDG